MPAMIKILSIPLAQAKESGGDKRLRILSPSL
jgi:hypothetical protein